MPERYDALLKQIATDPSCLRQVMAVLDQEETPDDRLLDTILGIPIFEYHIEPRSNESEREFRDHYGNEQFVYAGTPYNYIRDTLRCLNPQPADVVYDLGSGYGRFPLYGALTSPAQFVGVEIIPGRSRIAQAAKDRYSIGNARFVEGNVLDTDISDGTMFYLYQPFAPQTYQKVRETLYSISQRRKITVAFISDDDITPQFPWLRQTHSKGFLIKTYESNI